jgi:RNA polymerase sigma-70 factor (ECF subfamily)
MVVNSRDHALVQRCRIGDRQALETLIREYQRPVYNAAYRILGNPDDAADATQAAFLKVFENLDSYDPNYKFFSWIYRIAINESINQFKRNRKLQPLGDDDMPDAGGPESEAESDDQARWIQDGLMALNDEYRTVVVLRHFSDLSYREISDVLEIPEKTVKSRLYSARQLMKERLLTHGINI